MSFWQEKLDEYQEALASEEQMEVREDSMIQFLKERIQECLRHLN